MTRSLLRRLVVTLAFAASARHAGADALGLGYRDWRPLDLRDPSLKGSAVEKDADAEILFWEVHAYDEYSGHPYSIQDHYVRMKIFTKKGAETYGDVQLDFGSRHVISDVRGRTTKADGTIVELKSEDVHERTLARSGRQAMHEKSFSMPAVEPGAVVEYQWRDRGNALFTNVRYPLQGPAPARELRFFIKPLVRDWMPYTMSVRAFHTDLPRWEETHDGFHTITLKNVPAFRAESRMPPPDEVRPFMLVYYSSNPSTKADKYWKDYAKELYDWYKTSLSPNEDVRTAARTAVGDAVDPAEKLHRIYEFCRREIRKTDDYDVPLHEEQLEEDRKQHQANTRTLADRKGSNRDINVLFGAMAAAAGFTVRMGAATDREDVFLDETFLNDHLLTDHVVAVRDGERWRFFDPGSARVPAGMLDWRNEGLKILVGDPATAGFVDSPLSVPAQSVLRRTATLKLTEDGALAGDVRIEQTGHGGSGERAAYADLAEGARLEKLRGDLGHAFPAAEIEGVRLENVDDVDKPLIFACHVRIPEYAQRTGKRLILQPALFQHGVDTLFAVATRTHPVYFHYPWAEEDKLSFEVPPGYELDNPQTPAPVSGGAAADYKVKLMLARNPYTVIYERKLSFGGDGALLYGKESYPVLKQLFDAVHLEDGFSIALKQNLP